MINLFRRTSAALAVVVVALVLSGCQGSTAGQGKATAGAATTEQSTETSSDDGETTSEPPASSTGQGRPAPVGRTSTVGTTPPQTSMSVPAAPTSIDEARTASPSTLTVTTSGDTDALPECLYGDWVASNDWFASAVAQLSGGAAHYISGDVLVTFKPDGTAETHYRKWTNEFVVEDVTITVVRDGKDTANYTVEEDGSFAMQDVKLSSKLTMTGHSPQGAVIMGDPHPEPASATGTFLCVDKLLYVQTGDGEMVLGRPGLVDGS